ncbi:MAG: tetratricopeptide repeat protein [Spirochaetaceae bacterium]
MSAHDAIHQGQTVQDLIENARAAVSEHRLVEAAELLEHALTVDFDHPDLVVSLKYVRFWIDRLSLLEQIGSALEQGEFLLSQWQNFLHFVDRVGEASEPWMAAVRAHVFGAALVNYQSVAEQAGSADTELLLRLGRCEKALGHYDSALSALERAGKVRREDAQILAELADCYALTGEAVKAKAFFREAFFISPQRINISSLESQMICRLIEKVREEGLEGAELAEWVPVYGVLYGVFSVKRELRAIEYGKLRQSIYALEREIHEVKDPATIDGSKKARLINRYFWLIDHYSNTGEERSKIDEILLKIRELSMKIYQRYTN